MVSLNPIWFVAAIVVMIAFSVRAVQVEQRLWRRCRHGGSCLQLQRQITRGKAHCR
jgi:hypothetical protein